MRPRRAALLLAASVVLSGCTMPLYSPTTRYEASFLTLFDTVTTIVGYADSKEAFTQTAQQLHDQLLEYHQLFDIYNSYPGITNLRTVNEQASTEPVEVDRRIIDLLLFCRGIHDQTDGAVNAAMGSVLSLWHDARTAGLQAPASAALPDEDALREAARHTDFDDVIIDAEASTVFFRDPELKLDVGAIAKGYAVEQVCRSAPAGLLLSVGGNVIATGPRPDSGEPWTVGVQDPQGKTGDYLHTLSLSQGAVVTSGDYQRRYTVNGVSYHHIIHPETLMPAGLWRCVTVLCPDSAAADALSTALFLLPQSEGQALLELWGAEAMWVTKDGEEYFSPGFSLHIKT